MTEANELEEGVTPAPPRGSLLGSRPGTLRLCSLVLRPQAHTPQLVLGKGVQGSGVQGFP